MEMHHLTALIVILTLATPVAALADDPVILAVGDIASCGADSLGDEATASLVSGLAGDILALGDLAYDKGSEDDFRKCYEPAWGKLKARTHPVPGNHEYYTKDAKSYFAYFGAAAGAVGAGWYSFDIGTWHIVALNSNCEEIGGCGRSSPQGQWLTQDLEQHP